METEKKAATTKKNNKQKKDSTFIIVMVIFLLLSALLIFLMITLQPETTGLIRDIAIVIFALESLLIVISLILLIVQLSILVNLTQTEIKPILTTTKETVNNVKGTVVFLGNHMAEPVIKTNATVTGISKAGSLLSTLIKKESGGSRLK